MGPSGTLGSNRTTTRFLKGGQRDHGSVSKRGVPGIAFHLDRKINELKGCQEC